MENLTMPENTTLVTMDVTSLYTSLGIGSDFQITRYVCWTMSAFRFKISLCLLEIHIDLIYY
jgi:hypothetical protein